MLLSAVLAVSMIAPYAAAHCKITTAYGLKNGQKAGITGSPIGYDPSVPLSGGNLQDVPIFNERSMWVWKGCGRNIKAGMLSSRPKDYNAAGLTFLSQSQKGIAQVFPGGQLFMILHQVNGDGNGPFICGIDSTNNPEPEDFEELEIAKQVPGNNPELNAIAHTNFPLIVNIPKDIKCEGVYGDIKNVCMVRCQNRAINGPFGSCVPVQLVAADKLTGAFSKRDSNDDEEEGINWSRGSAVSKRATEGQIAGLMADYEMSLKKRQEEAAPKPEVKTPEVGKGASEDDIAKLMASADIPAKMVKRQDETPKPEVKTPEVGKGASDADIAKLMASADIPTKKVKREAVTEAEKVEDTVKALTEGDAVPEKELNKLRDQVRARLRNGTIPAKVEEGRKRVHEKKVRLRKTGSFREKSKGGSSDKKSSDRKPSDRKPSDRKPSDRKPSDRKPAEKKKDN
ncbi:hypothetical protein TWF481_004102 [Arthrobotrys musiformis]|uniref:Uncharacterized protein n=1 Tax=Arthrobotrys musiformis TaxID=47236 RepID=A0AAV9WKF5_9PEZI